MSACGVEATPTESGEGQSQTSALTSGQAALARWSGVIGLPIVPVSAANLPDGRVLMWSAEDRFNFGNDLGRTYTIVFDPITGASTERLVSETGHDMFCPGTANLPDGRILVNGGLSSGKTSIYDPATGLWTTAATMNIPRAYQGTTPLADGSVLTLGGSWAGGVGNKHGEVWTAAGGWRRLSGVPIDPFLSVDPSRNFGMDSHLWLLSAGNGRVLAAGPGINMNWIDPAGNGRVLPIGRRGDDQFSINGNAAMFDIGRVLKVGGAPAYDSANSNANSYVIELGTSVSVRKLPPMAYRRAFHNSVVLPNGQVVIIGGATVAVGFSDNNSVLAPEVFDPLTETFAVLPAMAVPRNYHSVALLLPDGRVLSAGGGLCGSGCAANHADLQILSPPYLFNADGTPAARPSIVSAPDAADHGTAMDVVTDVPVTDFSLIRASSTTHALNNDQRRLPLSFELVAANQYAVEVPSNPGWALPGVYFLFAFDALGVPSIAKTLRIGTTTSLRLDPVGSQSTTRDAEVLLQLSATSASGALLGYEAEGLPPGLELDAETGLISGIATTTGVFAVEVGVTDGEQTVSTELTWTVSEPGTTRFVRFEALSEINGNPWTSAAEITLLDEDGQPLSSGGFVAIADSEELTGENGAAANAIDGDPATIWHTQWQAANPPPPHWLEIDLGGAFRIAGLRYLPRQDASTNGTVGQYRVYLSSDGVQWGTPVSEGNLAQLGAAAAEKVVHFNDVARGKNATQSSTASSAVAARAVDGNRNGVFSAGSVTQTNSELNAFWEVDLGASHEIHAVRLWNRTDCCGERLTNFYVLASDAPMTGRTLSQLLGDPSVAGVHMSGTAPATQLFALRTRARYVRVQLAATNTLHLAEVEVYARLADNRAPVLSQPSAPTTTLGTTADLTLQGSDPDGDALTYSAEGLPPGLTVAASTGVISGTATAVGSYVVTATVSDGRGGSAFVSFNWFVSTAPPTVQPVSAPIAANGSTVTYVASAIGDGVLEYQWSFGDGTETSAWSTDPSVSHTFAGPGAYTVTVTVRDGIGAAVSHEFIQAVAGAALPGTAVSSSQLVLEPRSGANARLWVVNPDADTVSVFDAVTRGKLAEIAVGAQPRTLARAPDGRVWVANQAAGTLSVISPATLAVVQTVSMPRASQPYGVVVGGDGSVYVALSATGRVSKLSSTGAVQASADVGPKPRHLALTAAGDRLLVARFVTPPQPGEATAVVEGSVDGVKTGGQVIVLNTATLAASRTVTLEHSEREDTTVSGRGVPNYLGAPAISPDGTSAWIPSKQDNIGRGALRDGRNLDFQNTVRAISSRIDLTTEREDPGARIDHDNAGVASAAAYHPSGVYLFVALETSRQVAVVDAYRGDELFRVDAGRAPQAVLTSADGRTLYVHNFMDRTISVYDLSGLVDLGASALPLIATASSVASEKLSAQVLVGKRLFYDARDTRLARDAYMSCASCHNDGGDDGRTWDLTGMGEGLRNTINLRGRAAKHGRLHWTANFDELQDFEGQIRGLAQGSGLMSDAQFNTGTRSQPLGDAKAGLSADLDALAVYVGSLGSFDQSPHRTSTGALTSEAVTGRTVFLNECAKCHSGADYSDSGSLSMRDIGSLKPSSGQRLGGPLTALDTPTLRDAWATAPYLHDGSAATIEAAIAAHQNLSLPASDATNVAAFVRQIGAEEAALTPPVESGLTARYYPNSTLGGQPTLIRTEAVDFNWGTAAPATGIPADRFSVRWTGKLIAPSTGSYRLQTSSSDGVRVRLNGSLVISNWTNHSTTTNTSSSISLTAGTRYDISVEYYENTGSAVMQLRWRLPGTLSYVAIPAAQLVPGGVGLTGHYFGNNALNGAPVLTRTENVNFNWGTASPGTPVPADNYSVRWSGQLNAPATGTYRLRTNSDDGVRVWLNGTPLISNWTAHSATLDTSPAIQLVAGERYDITVEYNELGGSAVMQLSWLTPSTSTYAAIPADQLFPTGVGLKGLYFANTALGGTAVLTRTEAVGFDWGTASPSPAVPAEAFSARWTGQVQAPMTGSYTFQTLSDDGVRLWVNGTQVINNWTAHSATIDTSAAISLVAGRRYDITLEYNELGGDATMQLFWRTPNAPGYVLVPKGRLHGQ